MPQDSNRNKGPLAFIGEIGFAFQMISHFLRTSAPDITPGTFKRFFFPAHGNEERVQSIVGFAGSDPYVIQHVVHGIDGDYMTAKKGTTYIIRDFDLFMKCSTKLGHRGDYLPELFFKCFKGAALNAQPERYGQCPYGNWDEYNLTEPHFMCKERFPEQSETIRNIVREHLDGYLGKWEEIGKMMRLLVWNVYTTTSFGVPPSEQTKYMLSVYEEHLKEFDYAVRMAGAHLPYEWSPKLKKLVQEIEDWGRGIFEDRVANIDKYKHQADVLTDAILNHSDVDIYKSEGAIRGVYDGGFGNFHSAISGALMYNAQHNDVVREYYLQNPDENMEHILREALRLYTSVPTFRNVREQDDIEIDGKKLPVGTDIILSTYAINTDPRSWERPMEWDPSRFKNTKEIGFLCQKGYAPLGASHNLGGRPCGARYHIQTMFNAMMDCILREYKMTARGGHFEFRQNSGATRYAGHCMVKVEKR